MEYQSILAWSRAVLTHRECGRLAITDTTCTIVGLDVWTVVMERCAVQACNQTL